MKLTFRPLCGETDWAYVQEHAGVLRVADTMGFVWEDELGGLVGAAIMDNWTDNSVHMHQVMTSLEVLKQDGHREVFDFVFNEMGRKYIYGMVPGDNEKAIKVNLTMGFTEKVRLVEAWADGVDWIMFEMAKENCRYLPVREVA